MNFFAGMTAGFGEEQGKYNQKRMDFANEESKTMATLYGHLADAADDPDMQAEYARRASSWAGPAGNPLMDPKGYKQNVKAEKGGIHSVVSQKHQSDLADYHEKNFGTPQTPPGQPPPSTSGGGGGQASTQPSPAPPLSYGGSNTPPSPIPNMNMGGSIPQAPPQPAPQPQAPTGSPIGPTGHQFTPGQEGAPPVTNMPQQQTSTPMPSMVPPPAGTGQGGPPQPQGQTATGQQPQDMMSYAKSLVGPEPQPAYGPTGRETIPHKMWRDELTKRMEGSVPTPAGMHPFVGADFMPSGLANPMSMMYRADMQANARLYPNGYKLGPDNKPTPLDPSEYSAMAQIKMQKDQNKAALDAATIPLRQAMVQFTQSKNQLIPIEMKVHLAQLGMQQEHLRLQELTINASLFGRDDKGNPIPGSIVMPDGTVIGQSRAHNVLPTGATQGKAETAVPVMQQTDKLMAFASDPQNQNLFGPIMGNFDAWLGGKNMTNDPKEGPLRADLISLASLMVPMHGFRSQKSAEEFMGRLAQGMPLQGFIAALKAFNAVGSNLYDNGMPNLVGGSGQTTPRIAKPGGFNPTPNNNQSAPPSFAVGKVFSKNGKKYKVTAVHPDGGVDADEIK